MKEPINIVIADDHQLFTQGLKNIFEKYAFIHIVDIVHDGRELLKILTPDNNYIIILDINMPHLNGLDAAMKIKHQFAGTKIIFLSMYAEGYMIQKAKECGGKGYVLKTTDTKDLIDAIVCIHEGGEYFQNFEVPQIPDFIYDSISAKYKLTRRELEILGLLQEEMTNKEISDKLFLSIYTVETHRKNIMQKLNLKTPGALIRFFMKDQH